MPEVSGSGVVLVLTSGGCIGTADRALSPMTILERDNRVPRVGVMREVDDSEVTFKCVSEWSGDFFQSRNTPSIARAKVLPYH